MRRTWTVAPMLLVLTVAAHLSATAAPIPVRAAAGRLERVRAHGVAGAPAGVARTQAAGRSVSVPLAGGGSIVVGQVWVGSSMELRVQKLDAAGAPLWGSYGQRVASGLFELAYPAVVPDTSGGAIVAWEDDRSGETDVYAQRVDGSGSVVWTDGGVPLCTAPLWQGTVALVPDGAGGAIAGWLDERTGTSTDVYAQRVDASGLVQWTANGLAVRVQPGTASGLCGASADSGAAIFAWADARGADDDIYAQRVSADGHTRWPDNGIAVCAQPGQQRSLSMAASGWGVVIAWTDAQASLDIRAQRLLFNGALAWSFNNGVPVCTDGADQNEAALASDGTGGAILAWRDWRGGGSDLYAQLVDSTGVARWGADGVPLCAASGDQANLRLLADGAAGAFAAWEDWRGNGDVYAQHLDASGARTWSPADGVLVCGAPDAQGAPAVAGDGGLGLVVSWLDYRSYFDQDVYAQHLDVGGAPQWAANGVPAVVAPGVQMNRAVANIGGNTTMVAWNEKMNGLYAVRACAYDSSGVAVAPAVTLSAADDRSHPYPHIASDESGGAILAWEDFDAATYTTNVRGQRVAADGTPQWSPGGEHVCDAAGDQWITGVVSDGNGGAVFGWLDHRNGQWDLYAQRLDDGALPLWTANGVAVCDAPGGRQTSALVESPGGTIFVWDDGRNGNLDVYAQRLDDSGSAQWTANGEPLCTASGDQRDVAATIDMAGGAFVAWTDYRGGGADVYAQRVSTFGTPLWAADGVVIAAALGYQEFSQIVSDAAGGATVAWNDSRVAGLTGVYAQHVNGAGATQWTANGVLLAPSTTFYMFGSALVADGLGGAILAWTDWRDGIGNAQVYAQRVGADGLTQWAAGGEPVCTVAQDQLAPSAVTDGAGGAVIEWEDWRDGISSVLFHQRVGPNGTWRWLADGNVAVAMALRIAGMRDGRVHLEWQLDASVPMTANVYRQGADAAWTLLGTATAGAGGIVAWDDAGATPGARVAYRIGVVDGGREVLSAPAWVDVPAVAVFALELPRPNPVAGALQVAFSLPRAGGARIELIDLAGRRVIERALPSLPAGRNTAQLAARGELASGLYWVRITSGGHALTRKVCVVN